jgi:hypothetical protein
MKNIVHIVISTAFFFRAATFASADTMLSNLTAANSFASSIAGNYGGIEFSTGSLAPVWSLDSATLEFGGPSQWGASDTGPILYSAYIYNSSNNAPTTQLGFLGSFNYTNQTASVLPVTFNPSTAISISSNSAYWILVSAVTTCPAGILEGTGGHFNSVTGNGWLFRTYGYYYGSGNQISGSPNPGVSIPYLQIQATVETVPEPFTFALVGLGAAMLVFCHWHIRPQSARHDHAA